LYNMKGNAPEFTSHEQAKVFLDTSILAYNETVAMFTGREDGFEFIFSTTEMSEAERGQLRQWCEGFIKGLRITGVDPAQFDQDFVALLSPIAFCARPDIFGNESGDTGFAGKLERIAQEMPANLTALRNYFYLHLQKTRLRTGPGNLVGRNDPCPCGSGKKYKQCCGRS